MPSPSDSGARPRPAPAAPLLRDVRASDVAAITALYANEVRDHVATYEYDAPDAAEMANRVAQIVAAGYPFIVAECDGVFAGYAYASSYRSRIGYRWTVEDTVYVEPAMHGRGIGRVLLQELIRRCEARGYRQMVAVIGEPANEVSIALHRKLGFEVQFVFPGLGRKHGRWLDTVQMLRPLGDGSATPPADE